MKRLRYLIAPLLIWLLFLLKAKVYFRIYPVVMTGIMLTIFIVSLWRTPMAEVFARELGHQLDADKVRYCRKVTFAWIGFFGVNLGIATWTLFIDIKYWAFYNGFLSYILMGLLLIVEWIVRRLRWGREGLRRK